MFEVVCFLELSFWGKFFRLLFLVLVLLVFDFVKLLELDKKEGGNGVLCVSIFVVLDKV